MILSTLKLFPVNGRMLNLTAQTAFSTSQGTSLGSIPTGGIAGSEGVCGLGHFDVYPHTGFCGQHRTRLGGPKSQMRRNLPIGEGLQGRVHVAGVAKVLHAREAWETSAHRERGR